MGQNWRVYGNSYTQMVRHLRETEDSVEFGMVICFLSDHEAKSRLELWHILHEWPL